MRRRGLGPPGPAARPLDVVQNFPAPDEGRRRGSFVLFGEVQKSFRVKRHQQPPPGGTAL